WDKITRRPNLTLDEITEILADRLSGMGIKTSDIEDAIKTTGLTGKLSEWPSEGMIRLVSSLRKKSKPVLLAANKIDIPQASPNLENLKAIDPLTIAVSAEAELALRRAAEKGMISYKPGDSVFTIKEEFPITPEHRSALRAISEKVLTRFQTTGVQDCIN